MAMNETLTMADNTPAPYQDIYAEIKETLLISRNQAYSAVNFAMVQAYWHIGRIIVEHEQNGSLRAEYGKAVLQGLSERLTEKFGKGFDVEICAICGRFIAPSQNGTRCVPN